MALTGKFIADFSSFQEAVAKAEVSLKSLGDGASKVGPQLNRMVDNFSGRKLIQDAEVMVRAIEEVGGVSKLTASELESVSGKAQQAAEKMRAMGVDVPKGLQDVADAGKNTTSSMESMTTSVLKMAAGWLTAQAALAVASKAWSLVTGFIEASVVAAIEGENAQSKLTAAMRAQDTAMPSVIALYQEYSAQLQATTIYSAAAGQAAMALLVQIGNVMPRDMKKALDATSDLAAGLGIDLVDAATMVAKAATGNVTALNKVGVATKDTEGKTKDFAGVLDAINDKFGGQASAAANTYAGRVAQLGNAWGDVQESVGRAITTNGTLLEAVNSITGSLRDNTGELKENQAVTNFVSDAVVLAVRAFALLSNAVGYIAQVTAPVIVVLEYLTKGLNYTMVAVVKFVELTAAMGDTGMKKALPQVLKLQQGLLSLETGFGKAAKGTVDFALGAYTLAEKANGLADELEKTRGKTVDVTRASAEVPGVMNRSTKALVDNTEAHKALVAAQQKYADSLRDITDNLSGGKAIDKANLWLQALSQTIPIYQMSADKQAEVNKVMGEAIAAYSSLGEVAPQAMRDLWAATVPAIAATTSLDTVMKTVGATTLPLFARQTVSAIGVLRDGGTGLDVARAQTIDFNKAIQDLGGAFVQMAQVSGSSWGGVAQDIGVVLNAMGAAQQGAATFKAGLSNLGKTGGMTAGNMASTAAGAVAVAGSFVAATKGASKLNATLNGAAIGFSVAGPWGAAVGAAAGFIISLFGPSEVEKARKARAQWVDSAGGITAIAEEARKAGVSLDALLDAKKVKDVEKAVNDLQAAFAFQQQAMADLDEVTQRYGFTLEELGPTLQKQELDKQAQQLFHDWEVLNAAGIDTVAISNRMSESINAYVQNALAMGSEVPEAMRPMLQHMVEMGLLTDKNGEKITDLEGSGISFAMSMSDGFKALITSVEKLSKVIASSLGVAIDDTTDKINKIPKSVDVAVKYTESQTPTSPFNRKPIEGYQHGTDGFRDFGAGTPVMLHGWEAVVPRAQASEPGAVPGLLSAASSGGGASASAGLGGGGEQAVVINIDARGALFNDPGSDQRLADRIEQALNAKHGLTHRRRAA
jgi:hypothetical protein